MNNNSTDEAKDKGRIITEEPLIIVPELYASRLKTIIVHSLMLVDQRDHYSAALAGHAVRLAWPGFKAA